MSKEPTMKDLLNAIQQINSRITNLEYSINQTKQKVEQAIQAIYELKDDTATNNQLLQQTQKQYGKLTKEVEALKAVNS